MMTGIGLILLAAAVGYLADRLHNAIMEVVRAMRVSK